MGQILDSCDYSQKVALWETCGTLALTLTSPSNDLDCLVEALEKAGSVAVREWCGPTRSCSEFSKMGEQRPARKGLANGILGERVAAWSEYQGPFVKAARGQWDVPSDYNVIHRDMLSNPVIGGVELPCDNHKADGTQIRNSNPRVGDHCNVEPVSLRNPVHLLLYGAAIGIDEYFKHYSPLLHT